MKPEGREKPRRFFEPQPVLADMVVQPFVVGWELPMCALLLGELRITRIEASYFDRDLADVMSTRLYAVLEAAHDQLVAPTLPVHDEPMPKSLQP